MRGSLLIALLLTAASAAAQHDITMVEPAAPDAAIATPLPQHQQRQLKKYDLPELSGAQQALGPQLIDGNLRRPLVDYTLTQGQIVQRISIFEKGLVVVKLTGASSIRKRVLIPEDALASYMKTISAEALRAIPAESLGRPEAGRSGHLRIYAADGAHVDRFFIPDQVPPKQLVDQTAPLYDLMRAIVEDREVTSSVAGYEPKPGDRLVSDDQKTFRVVRVMESDGVVELTCVDVPLTIFIAKKDLHLYFIGAKGQ